MLGRDRHEDHRAATPLELLFDLAFVVAFGIAANELAHGIAVGHVGSALGAFAFVMFAIVWAWINFSWFASAFDTDDWFYRVTTMVQMVGVVVLALGIPPIFESIDAGGTLDNGVMVAGYVIMRVAMIVQWLRVAAQSPTYRRTALTYAIFVVIAQIGWVLLVVSGLPFGTPFVVIAIVLYLVETGGPVVAELRGPATPWHPHHIAERYGLLAIIALGEGVLGTVAAVSTIVAEQGWSADAIVIVAAGVVLTFGLWWVYFMLPSGNALAASSPHRGFVWGYGNLVAFAAIAAVGAGLHVAAYYVEGEAEIGQTGVALSIVVPIAVLTLALFVVHLWLVRSLDPLHVIQVAGVFVVLAASVVLASSVAPMPVWMMVAALSPVVVIASYETIGRRHVEDAVQRLRRDYPTESAGS